MKEKMGNTIGVIGIIILLASLFASLFMGEGLIDLFWGGLLLAGLGLAITVSS